MVQVPGEFHLQETLVNSHCKYSIIVRRVVCLAQRGSSVPGGDTCHMELLAAVTASTDWFLLTGRNDDKCNPGTFHLNSASAQIPISATKRCSLRRQQKEF